MGEAWRGRDEDVTVHHPIVAEHGDLTLARQLPSRDGALTLSPPASNAPDLLARARTELHH
jgi:hypothetical protein